MRIGRRTPRASFALLALLALGASPAGAARRGLVDVAEGVVELRGGNSPEAEVVATLKAGEPFAFDRERGAAWCAVTLASGATGWLPLEAIRLDYAEEDLPAPEPRSAEPSEIDALARAHGFDYAVAARRAAQGDAKALERILSLGRHVDGAAAESYAGVPTAVYHRLGDERFAAFLQARPADFRSFVRNLVVGDCPLPPGSDYLRRHFPVTAGVLFPQEIVGWTSPDGRYAIRKVFDDAFDLVASHVVRAELILRDGGQLLCDLTPDDIGTGPDREGEVLWSPDSKRFACLSSDLTQTAGSLFSTPPPAPQRKQTAVYQLAGESAVRIDLKLDEVPGREADVELAGAILGHEYTTPIRWKSAAVLVLDRHEYYEKKVPLTVGETTFESIVPLGRRYRIEATLQPQGTATVVWTPRK